MIIQTYSLKTILITSPALFIYEVASFLFLLMKGSHKAYFRAIYDVILNSRKLLEKRGKTQYIRTVDDKELMDSGQIYIADGHINKGPMKIGVTILNFFFNIYWHAIKNLL